MRVIMTFDFISNIHLEITNKGIFSFVSNYIISCNFKPFRSLQEVLERIKSFYFLLYSNLSLELINLNSYSYS